MLHKHCIHIFYRITHDVMLFTRGRRSLSTRVRRWFSAGLSWDNHPEGQREGIVYLSHGIMCPYPRNFIPTIYIHAVRSRPFFASRRLHALLYLCKGHFYRTSDRSVPKILLSYHGDYGRWQKSAYCSLLSYDLRCLLFLTFSLFFVIF